VPEDSAVGVLLSGRRITVRGAITPSIVSVLEAALHAATTGDATGPLLVDLTEVTYLGPDIPTVLTRARHALPPAVAMVVTCAPAMAPDLASVEQGIAVVACPPAGSPTKAPGSTRTLPHQRGPADADAPVAPSEIPLITCAMFLDLLHDDMVLVRGTPTWYAADAVDIFLGLRPGDLPTVVTTQIARSLLRRAGGHLHSAVDEANAVLRAAST
jgi:hypothetical protein